MRVLRLRSRASSALISLSSERRLLSSSAAATSPAISAAKLSSTPAAASHGAGPCGRRQIRLLPLWRIRSRRHTCRLRAAWAGAIALARGTTRAHEHVMHIASWAIVAARHPLLARPSWHCVRRKAVKHRDKTPERCERNRASNGSSVRVHNYLLATTFFCAGDHFHMQSDHFVMYLRPLSARLFAS